MLTRWLLAGLFALGPGLATAETSGLTLPAIFVAPRGDDAGDGSFERPLRGFDRIEPALLRTGARQVYLRGGLYRLPATVRLGGQAAGATISGFPGETAVLDGSTLRNAPMLEIEDTHGLSLIGLTFVNGPADMPALSILRSKGITVSANRLADVGTAILLTGTRDSTIRGNRLQRSVQSGIEVKDGSDDNRFEQNLVDGTGALAAHGGGLFLHGASRNHIAHNVVQNTAGAGIVIANWDDATINTDNTIASNLVQHSNLLSTDSGAIYLLGRSGVDMRTRVVDNVIEGTGAGGDAHTIGIYLDDSASGVLVEGNIVLGVGTHAAQVHGGDNVTIRGNLFDLGAGAASSVLFQAAPADVNPRNTMLGNTVSGNVSLTDNPAATTLTIIDGGAPEVTNDTIRCGACPLPRNDATTAR